LTYHAVAIHSNKQLERLVVVVSILAGTAPVYFTSKTHEQAWMRRDGGIVKMSQDVIVERITRGKRLTQELQDELQQVPGRKKLVLQSLDFLKKEQPQTKILVLHGMASVGKTHVVEFLRQKILTDRKAFPVRPQIYWLDLKSSEKKGLGVKAALI